MLKILEKYANEMSGENLFYSLLSDDLANMSYDERKIAETVFADFSPYLNQHELDFSFLPQDSYATDI